VGWSSALKCEISGVDALDASSPAMVWTSLAIERNADKECALLEGAGVAFERYNAGE